MTLPKKGRRSISVDSVEFHYMIPFERSERAVIQHASGHGACLFVFPRAIMKPRHVAEAIRFGLSKGWRLNHHGDDCWITFDIYSNGEPSFEHIPNDDSRVVSYSTNGRITESVAPTATTNPNGAKYVIRLMFEWGGGCLWCGNDAAFATFDAGPIEDRLNLSPEIRNRMEQLTKWHDTSLNGEYPPDPGPWTSEESQRFADAATALLALIRTELGPEFEVVYVPL